MPRTDSPDWWADVQQDRDELGGRRPAEEWLEEDLDFVPRRRFARGGGMDGVEADHTLHGVFVHAESQPQARTTTTTGGGIANEIVLTSSPAAEAGSWDLARDDQGPQGHTRTVPATASGPASDGARRTVRITGRPDERRSLTPARRHRPRTASDRVGHRPDRIALWAVLLGVILIILAFSSSDSQAATHAAAVLTAL